MTEERAEMTDKRTDIVSERADDPRALEVVSEAAPAAIGDLRSRAREFAARAGAEEAVVADIALAVSEAATNVVLHAYEEFGEGSVEMRARVEDEWLQFDVADHGSGFRPSPSGGLGFGLKVMAEVSDSMAVVQREDGTTVEMRFARFR